MNWRCLMIEQPDVIESKLSKAHQAIAKLHNQGISSAIEARQYCDELLRAWGADAADYRELSELLRPHM